MPRHQFSPEINWKQLEHLCSVEFNLKPGFSESILSDNDWGFVIKLHALLEAAMTDLITQRFNEPLLRKIISELGTSSESFSKSSVLKQLNLMSQTQRAFVRAFSRLRNSFAHDIARVGSTIQDYCEENETRDKELVKAAADILSEYKILQRKHGELNKIVSHSLRFSIGFAAILVTVEVVKASKKLQLEKMNKEIAVREQQLEIAKGLQVPQPQAPPG